jgi:hypothetical protein
LKSGSLNLLEPYGPVQECKGIALRLLDVAIVLFNDVMSTDGSYTAQFVRSKVVTKNVWRI